MNNRINTLFVTKIRLIKLFVVTSDKSMAREPESLCK